MQGHTGALQQKPGENCGLLNASTTPNSKECWGERAQRFSSQLKLSRFLCTGLHSMKSFYTPSITSVKLKGAAAWATSLFDCV